MAAAALSRRQFGRHLWLPSYALGRASIDIQPSHLWNMAGIPGDAGEAERGKPARLAGGWPAKPTLQDSSGTEAQLTDPDGGWSSYLARLDGGDRRVSESLPSVSQWSEKVANVIFS